MQPLRTLILLLYIITCLATSAAAPVSQEQLMRQCEEARSLSKYETLLDKSTQLIAAARLSHNVRTETFALFYQGLAMMFMGNTDQSLAMLDQAETLSDRSRNDSVKALVFNTKGIYHALIRNNSFVAQQYFFKSLALSRQSGYEDLQYRVLGNLLTLSQSVGGATALDQAEQVYQYGVKTHNDEQISVGAYHLASYYSQQGDYAKTEKYLKIALDIYRSYPYEDIASVHTLYAKTRLAQGKTDEAEQMAKQAIVLAQKYKQASMEVDAYVIYAEILSRRHDYSAAIGKVKQAMDKAAAIGMTSKTIKCNEMLSECYSRTGQSALAFSHLQQANALLQEQSTLNLERLSYELGVMQDIEQREIESIVRQRQIESQRHFLILLGVTVVILLALLIISIISYRRRQMLYKKIVLQNTAQ